MGWLDDNKPTMVMLALQFTYAGVSISIRASLLQGMNPRVFVVYRQAIGTLIIAPLAYFSRSKTRRCSLRWKSFCLIFMASLIGITISQNIFYEGMYLASSSVASAMFNLVPAITFLVAAIVGFEKVNIRSLRSIAKIAGTVVCVSGAAAMALLRGPKLLNAELPLSRSILGSSGGENWLLGCLFLFGSSCCWSFWLILQVPVSVSYPDHLSLTAWMCFMATLQSAAVAIFSDPNLEAWTINTYLELGTVIYTGIVGSGMSFFAQAWCIERRGPVFSAMFNPLNTVVVAIFASIFLHEEIYTGSLIGGFGIILGLYAVLWGKAKDIEETKKEEILNISENDQTKTVQILVDGSSDQTSCENNMEEPLLLKKINNC